VSASNDTSQLTPRTSFDGPALEFDFPGLEIGCAEYEEGPTGCTVFSFLPTGAACAVDVRGGSPGWLGQHEWVHAICLAGGSQYGLEAATGVAAEIFARREFAVGWTDIPLVAGAIVFDFGFRDTAIYPDKALGRAALRAARRGVFPLGQHGAGRAVTVGKTFGLEQREPGGQGGAYRQIGDTKVAVFTVLNAVGAIVDRDGSVVRGHLDPDRGERAPLVGGVEERVAAGLPIHPPPGATTLTVVITNQQLTARSLRSLGRQVHASMARGIQPFHTLYDGDVLYAVTTNEVAPAGLDDVGLGVVASELAWDAILSAVREEST
jgi:L-aminopeptidase/D-esterase-like protein